MPRFVPGAPGWSLLLGQRALVTRLGLLAAADAGILGAANTLQTDWRRVLSRPGSGRLYAAGQAFFTSSTAPRRLVPFMSGQGRSHAHRASAPGEPPASDAGHLRAAVEVEREGVASYRVGMGGRIGRRGLALEFGVNTPGTKVGKHPAEGLRIDPRPHGRVAVADSQPNMRKSALQNMRRD